MDADKPKVLLASEHSQSLLYLVKHLEKLDCHYVFATSSNEVFSMLNGACFDLLLVPIRLGGVSLFHLTRHLRGTSLSLFLNHLAEDGYWWFPALCRGHYCFGSGALRPAEFVSVLEVTIAEIRSGLAPARQADLTP